MLSFSSSISSVVYVCVCPLQVKLAKYISKQLQCKQRVPLCERSLALSAFPHLVDWLHTINLRPEFIEVWCLLMGVCVFI